MKFKSMTRVGILALSMIMMAPIFGAQQNAGEQQTEASSLEDKFGECASLIIQNPRDAAQSKMLKQLLDASPELIYYYNPLRTATLLIIAASFGDLETTKLLLSKGAGKVEMYVEGRTVLECAKDRLKKIKNDIDRRDQETIIKLLEEAQEQRERAEQERERDRSSALQPLQEQQIDDGQPLAPEYVPEFSTLRFNSDEEVDLFVKNGLDNFLQHHKHLINELIVEAQKESGEYIKFTLLETMMGCRRLEEMKRLFENGASVFVVNSSECNLLESLAYMMGCADSRIEQNSENDGRENKNSYWENCKNKFMQIEELVNKQANKEKRAKIEAKIAALELKRKIGSSPRKQQLPQKKKLISDGNAIAGNDGGAKEPKPKFVIDFQNLNGKDANGQTQLIQAIIMNDLDAVQALMKLGVDTRAADNAGKTALKHASSLQDKSIKRYLRREFAEQNKAAKNKAANDKSASLLATGKPTQASAEIMPTQEQKDRDIEYANAVAKFKGNKEITTKEYQILRARYHCSNRQEEIRLQKLAGIHTPPVAKSKQQNSSWTVVAKPVVATAAQPKKNRKKRAHRNAKSRNGNIQAPKLEALKSVEPQKPALPLYPAGSSRYADQAERAEVQKIQEKMSGVPHADDMYDAAVAQFKQNIGYLEVAAADQLAEQLLSESDDGKPLKKQLHPEIKQDLLEKIQQLNEGKEKETE